MGSTVALLFLSPSPFSPISIISVETLEVDRETRGRSLVGRAVGKVGFFFPISSPNPDINPLVSRLLFPTAISENRFATALRVPVTSITTAVCQDQGIEQTVNRSSIGKNEKFITEY